jgi:hypothetical protein
MRKLFPRKRKPLANRTQVPIGTIGGLRAEAGIIDQNAANPDTTSSLSLTTLGVSSLEAGMSSAGQGSPGQSNQSNSLDVAALKYFALRPGEVRFLTLDAGPENHPIKCHLSSHPLEANLRYEALSYMWGPREPAIPIVINNTPVAVRENLYLALRAIRKKDRTRLLWIDALCINQEDIPERNSQVTLMTTIYQKAVQVLVWLGAEVPKLQKSVTFFYDYYHGSSNSFQIMKRTYMEDIISFLALPYWRRVWIIQEVICARNLEFYYGSWRIPLKCIDRILDLQEPRQWPVPISSIHATPAVMILLQRKQFSSRTEDALTKLTDLFRLSDLCKSECEDVRDKIYSFAGLIQLLDDRKALGFIPAELVGKPRLRLNPDYARTPVQVYADIFLLFLGRTQPPFDSEGHPLTIFFCDSVQKIQKLLGHPTWNDGFGQFDSLEAVLLESQLSALHNTEMHLKFKVLGSIIKIGGVVYTPDSDFPSEIVEADGVFGEFEPRVYRHGYMGKPSLASAGSLHVTQSLGLFQGSVSTSAPLKGKHRRSWCSASGYSSRSTGEARLFTTNYGSLGIASHDIRIGDFVCQFNDDSSRPLLVIVSCGSSMYEEPLPASNVTIVGRAFLQYMDGTAYHRIYSEEKSRSRFQQK